MWEAIQDGGGQNGGTHYVVNKDGGGANKWLLMMRIRTHLQRGARNYDTTHAKR